jgi:hypothetical protein
MDTYGYGYGLTGHYAKPGTHTSYCGRELMHEPNTGIRNRICQPCTKAERADRIAAEQHAAAFSVDTPPLTERAGVRYCTVGTGRRVHLSNNDDTLCGREVTEYTDGSAFVGGAELCARCDRAAEERAYARALAAASPLAAAAVALAEAVEAVDAEQAAAASVEAYVAREYPALAELLADGPTPNERRLATLRETIAATGGTWTTDRVDETLTAAGLPTNLASCWGLLRYVAAADGLTETGPAAYTAPTVEDVEARQAAELITEAEATEGTWRGQWISQQANDAALFTLAADAEQGALFT